MLWLVRMFFCFEKRFWIFKLARVNYILYKDNICDVDEKLFGEIKFLGKIIGFI